MKKLMFMIGAVLAMSSCSSEYVGPNEGTENTAEGITSIVQKFRNGSSMTVFTSEATEIASRSTDNMLIYDETDPLAPEEVANYTEMFLREFPPGEKNLEKSHADLDNFSFDFDLVSNGEPFTIYPLMVGGNARNILGISYFNGTEFVNVDVIDLTADEVIGNPDNGWACVQSGKGYTFELPKGIRYQFYIYNQHTYGTPLHGQPFYSNADRNYKNQAHAVTYSYQGHNFVAFEDLDLEGKGCDVDYNDVIFLITPEQQVFREVEIEIPIDFDRDQTCQVDDFALSNNVERYPEYYNIGADKNRKIHVDRYTDLKVKITDFENLVYNEEYKEWTYETWIWLEDPAEAETYLLGSADTPDYSFSKDNYRIGVSAYMGNESEGKVGYIKVSVHISMIRPDDED